MPLTCAVSRAIILGQVQFEKFSTVIRGPGGRGGDAGGSISKLDSRD
jgi:hypothetical protein